MRKAMMTAGILGGAMVVAIAVVAVVVFQGNSSSPKSSQAAGFTQASASASVSAQSPKAVKASMSPTAKKSAKPTASPTVKKTATPTPSATAATHKTTSSAPTLLTVPAGWKMTFDPGFSGSSLDTGTWATCYDWATDPSVGCNNNPADEKEWYIPSQVQVSGGAVNLVAKRQSVQGLSASGAAQTFTCRSGMISSKPGFNFTYGLIQISAKLPYGPGLWPALWLAATNDQWPPELDIMEHWYSQQDYKVYDHTVGKEYVGGPVPTPVNLSAGYHTYSLLWTKDRVTWYLDGVQKFTTTDHVPQQSMYFIANVADDSTASDACNGTMSIQSVKVWQP